MNLRNLVPYIIFACLLALVSCSEVNTLNTPSSNPTALGEISSSVLVSDRDENGAPIGGTGLLGAYQVSIDMQSMTGEMTPIRKAGSQDVVEVVDITNFLTVSPCTNCVELKSISMNSSGNLVLKIGIKHPFSFPNPSKPITGRNRADLHVFNIEGTVFMQTIVPSTTEFPILGEVAGELCLVNADGYSKYLDPSIDSIFPTDATIHPYILHFDDFGEGNFNPSNPYGFSDIIIPSGYLVMAQGSLLNYKNYEFDIDCLASQFDFIFGISCTYGLSAESKSERMEPVYRLPQFNKKAATKVWISNITENPPYGIQENEPTSSEVIEISILDMNHGVTIGTALNKMLHLSDIGTITVEIPQILNEPLVSTNPIPTGGSPKDINNPLTYEFVVTNELIADAGSYNGLVKVLDTYLPNLNGRIDADGISRTDPTELPDAGYFDIDEFATYTAFVIHVSPPNATPYSCFEIIPDGLTSYPINTPFGFDASCAFDPDGTIIQYEWDFDYDGDFTPSGQVGFYVTRSFVNLGSTTIACKVTDDGGKSDIETLTIDCTGIQNMTFGPELQIDDNVHTGGMPVGFHYSDSSGDSIYVAYSERIEVGPGLYHSKVFSIRSDDGGTSFLAPVEVQDEPEIEGSVDGVSCAKFTNDEISLVWLSNEGSIYFQAYHDVTTGGAYNFGTDVDFNSVVAPLASHVSHSVSGDETVFCSFSEWDQIGNLTFNIFLYYSIDSGSTWNEIPVNIPEAADDDISIHEYTCSIASDNLARLHAVYVYDFYGDGSVWEMRYTQSTYPYENNFTTYLPLETIPGYGPPYFSISLATNNDGSIIYVVYRSNDSGVWNIRMMKSEDGGLSFNPSVVIDDVLVSCDQPCVVTDNYGRVYVAYIEQAVGTDNVRVTRSLDQGDTWDSSVVANFSINTDRLGPTITVDEYFRIHVFWRDARLTPGTYKLFYTRGN